MTCFRKLLLLFDVVDSVCYDLEHDFVDADDIDADVADDIDTDDNVDDATADDNNAVILSSSEHEALRVN